MMRRLQPSAVPASAGWEIGGIDLLTRALWLIFLVVASGAFVHAGIQNVERYVWLPLDVVVVLAVVRNHELVLAAQRAWVFFSWPMIAAASALWSLNPLLSLYHAAQLFMTIAGGLLLATRFSRRDGLVLIFLAMLAAAVASLAINAEWLYSGAGWHGSWEGAFSHKNTLGQMMMLLTLTSVCLLLDRWRPWLSALGCALGIVLLQLSHSGSSLLAALVALSALPLMAIVRLGRTAIGLLAGAGLVAGAVLIAALSLSSVSAIDVVLSSLNRDATLTNRTILWDFGMTAYFEAPWLGHGFKAFWADQGPIVRELGSVVGAELSFFHNNFLEVAVAFGILGPLLLACGLAVALYRSLVMAALGHDQSSVWPLMITLATISLCFTENPLFQNHSLLQLLFIFALTSGWGPSKRAEAQG